jgi:peptide deformylase
MAYPTELSVRLYGARVLRQRAVAVAQITDEHAVLVQTMFREMYDSRGVGLAAPQVGISERIIVLDASCVQEGLTPKALINPIILSRAGRVKGPEGCLSVPGVEGQVRRAWSIRVAAHAVGHGAVEFTAEGFEARVIQHEIDHLDGKLFIDRLPWIEQWRVKRRLARDMDQLRAAISTETSAGPALL